MVIRAGRNIFTEHIDSGTYYLSSCATSRCATSTCVTMSRVLRGGLISRQEMPRRIQETVFPSVWGLVSFSKDFLYHRHGLSVYSALLVVGKRGGPAFVDAVNVRCECARRFLAVTCVAEPPLDAWGYGLDAV